MLLKNGRFVCSPPGEENRECEFPTAHRFLENGRFVSSPPGEENREREFPTAHSFLFDVRLPFRGLRPTGDR